MNPAEYVIRAAEKAVQWWFALEGEPGWDEVDTVMDKLKEAIKTYRGS